MFESAPIRAHEHQIMRDESRGIFIVLVRPEGLEIEISEWELLARANSYDRGDFVEAKIRAALEEYRRDRPSLPAGRHESRNFG